MLISRLTASIRFAFFLLLFAGSILPFTKEAKAGIIGNLDRVPDYFTVSRQDKFAYTGIFIPLLYNRSTGAVSSNSSVCTTTIIHASEEFGLWAIVSGHCGYTPTKVSYNSGIVRFATDNNADPAKELWVTDIITSADWINAANSGASSTTNFFGGVESDFALLRLANPARSTDSTAPIIPAWLKNIRKPIPQINPALTLNTTTVGDFAGAGLKANGAAGFTTAYDSQGDFMGGQNYISVRDKFLIYDLDSDLNTRTNFDQRPSVPLEYNPTGGDSGSPVMIGNEIYGIHSRSQGGTYVCAGNTRLCKFNRGGYGTIGYATRSDVFAGWVDNVIKAKPPSDVVSLRPANGGKITIPSGFPTTGPSYDAGSYEIDLSASSALIPVFIPTPDVFPKTFNETIHNQLQQLNNELVTGGGTTNQGTGTGGTPTPTPTPTLTNFSPTSGPVGTTVRIAGSGLQGVSSVVFYNGRSSNLISVNQYGTEITVTVPDGAVSGKFQLFYPNGLRLVSPSKFIVTP